MSEPCDRCGEVDEDRRTLHMACFYHMNELGIPFKNEIVFDTEIEKLVETKPAGTLDIPNGPSIVLEPPRYTTDGELIPCHQFTLRVCKKCRAEWLEAISNWWFSPIKPEESIGTGIYIRENGSIKEITEEEFHRRREQQIGD